MASSPEQEIPQEIIEKAARVLDVRTNGEEKVARRDVYDHWREYAQLAIAAVLSDLQRPLLEEIERLRTAIDAALSTTWTPDDPKAPDTGWGDEEDTLYPDRLAALAALQPHWLTWGDTAWGLAGDEMEKRRYVEAERDARPDLTAEEIHALLNHSYGQLLDSARAKLERSLDAR